MVVATRAGKAKAAADFVASHRETTDGGVDYFGITELAEELGISPRAIRFYEDKGLLNPRRINGGRAYSKRDKVRLSLILRGKAMGMSLEECKHILELYGQQGEGKARQLEYLISRIDQTTNELSARRHHIEATLAELAVVRHGLADELEQKKQSA